MESWFPIFLLICPQCSFNFRDLASIFSLWKFPYWSLNTPTSSASPSRCLRWCSPRRRRIYCGRGLVFIERRSGIFDFGAARCGALGSFFPFWRILCAGGRFKQPKWRSFGWVTDPAACPHWQPGQWEIVWRLSIRIPKLIRFRSGEIAVRPLNCDKTARIWLSFCSRRSFYFIGQRP